jgi:membrane protein
VVTALIFQLLKEAFSAVMARSSFQLVYGAFAAVPLFLLWVNLVWTLVLGGAILVRTLAERAYRTKEDTFSDMHAALACLELLHERCRRGGTLSDADCFRLGLGVVHWQRLRSLLERARWIASTASGRYVLIRDLRTITLWDLACVMGMRLGDLEYYAAREKSALWYEVYVERRRQLVEGAREAFNLPLETLLTAPLDAENPRDMPDRE